MIENIPFIINFYLIKSFLKRLGYVLISISLLILIINLFDVFNRIKGVEDISIFQVLFMAFLQIPSFIADISMFIIMLSAMITLSALSSKSEITVMRSFGLSLWKILSPIMITSFIIGIIFILIFMPLTIMANKQYSKMERELIKKEQLDSFSPKNGIWLRQVNMNNTEEEVKIRAKKIYKNNLRLEGVTVWFFDKYNKFYRRIDAKNMFLIDGSWHLQAVIINDNNRINEELDLMKIPTNLEPEFITQKIINNFEDVKLFSIISLPSLINNLESSGFPSRRFKVYFHTLLNQPLLFMGMVLVAGFFSINSIRSRHYMIYIVGGIIFGLLSYISLNIINALGSSGILPAFMSTWLITFLFLAVSTLLIFKKENVS